MRCLVTGGSGFIGSHVVDALLNAGHDVRIFDMRNPKWVDPIRVKKEPDFYQGSLLDLEQLRMALDDMEIVLHLAAVADVSLVEKAPFHAHRINVEGTLNLLEAMRYAGPKRIVYASTVWVYSGSTMGIVGENNALPVPNHFYTATKLTGEYYCMNYARHYELEYTILRYGIPYGPRARTAAVIPTFVGKALKGESLTIAGDGEQGRCFLYVEDLADAHVKVLENLEVSKNQVYNVDGKEKITINQIVGYLEKCPGIPLDVRRVYQEARRSDFTGQVVSIEKVKRDLGWVPTTSFDEGLRRYVEWYINNWK